MRKLVVVCALLAASLPGFVVLAQVPRAAIDTAGAATVFIETNRGSGSGFLFSADGYILTCNHVIDGATTIQVYIPGGKKLPGRLVQAAPEIDTAVLKVDTAVQTYLSLGNSATAAYGDAVAAIGYPARVFTVTVGTVSAFPTMGQTQIMQVTAPVNPGNSGGPLIHYSGEVIGIIFAGADAAEYLRQYGFIPQAVNYAVPINVVKERFGLAAVDWRLFLESTLVFEDDFSQPRSWRVPSAPDGIFGVFDDVVLGPSFHVICYKQEGGWHFVDVPDVNPSNFILELDVRSASALPSQPERIMIMFRYQYNNLAFTYGILNIFTDGYIELISVLRDQWGTILAKQPSSAIRRDRGVNHVCLIARNSELIVEINHQEAARVSRCHVTGEGDINIGVWTLRAGDNAHVLFTNVRVYKLP
jgi:hypothetical protein